LFLPRHQHPNWTSLQSELGRLGGGNAIDRITYDGVAALALDDDDVVLFLTDDDTDLSRILHGVQEDLVAEDIELLLVVASGIGCPCQAKEVDQRRPPDVVRNELACQLQPKMHTRQQGTRLAPQLTGVLRIEEDGQVAGRSLSKLLLLLQDMLRTVRQGGEMERVIRTLVSVGMSVFNVRLSACERSPLLFILKILCQRRMQVSFRRGLEVLFAWAFLFWGGSG